MSEFDANLSKKDLLFPESRIITFAQACSLLAIAREEEIDTVLAQGVFDVLHVGHLQYLTESAKYGMLFVGTEKDESVSKNKGEDRPINAAQERLAMLAALRCIDFVFCYEDIPDYFDSSTFLNRLNSLRPKYLAISLPEVDLHSERKQNQANDTNIIPVLIGGDQRKSSTEIIDKLGLKKFDFN